MRGDWRVIQGDWGLIWLKIGVDILCELVYNGRVKRLVKDWRAMILAQSKSNGLIWHCVTLHNDEARMICRPMLAARRKTVRDYTPKVMMCVDCQETLWRLDPKWKLKMSEVMKAKDRPRSPFDEVNPDPKPQVFNDVGKKPSTFDQVVQKLIKSRRY